MLEYFRKNTKSIAWLMVASFVIWGVGSAVFSGSGGSNTAGKVFGKKISNQEFNRHMKLIRIFGGENIEAKDQASLENLVWEQIALVMKAKREGITVSNEEVSDTVTKLMSPSQTYDQELYKRWVNNVFQESPRIFEEKIRELVALRKLVDKIPSEVTLTDEALKQKYFKANPDAKPEEFDKMKEGYRQAMTELAQRETRKKYIDQILHEANIQSYLEDRRTAEKEREEKVSVQLPGSQLPYGTPVPKPISKEETSVPSKNG